MGIGAQHQTIEFKPIKKPIKKPVKQLTRLLADIDPGTNFTVPALIGRIEATMTHVLTGGMERSEFERRLFAFDNLAHLPIGHLLDHRVRMPEDRSEQIIDEGERALREHLRNMLCSQHSQGSDLVAEALGLQPEDDSLLLIEAHRSHPDFVRLCLSGLHGHALSRLPGMPTGAAPKLRRILVRTAIYFGALELQLIGVRQRALGEYRFAVAGDKMSDTMGALINDLRQLVASLKKAQLGVFSDEKLLGRRTDLIAAAKPLADQVLERAKAERPGFTEAELLEELQELYRFIAPTIEAADAVLNGLPSTDDPDDDGNDDPPVEPDGTTNSGLRQRIPTAWGGGVSGGEQLAFASLRLHAFARHLPKIADKLETRIPQQRNDWFSALAGDRNRQVAKLVLVSRSAVWAKSQFPAAYAPNGAQLDLREAFENWSKRGKTPNEELLFSTKQKVRSWKNNMPSGANERLVGYQLWDIHPDYRFAAEDLRPTVPLIRFRIPKAFEVKKHQPSPQYRAPRKSHRPC